MYTITYKKLTYKNIKLCKSYNIKFKYKIMQVIYSLNIKLCELYNI